VSLTISGHEIVSRIDLDIAPASFSACWAERTRQVHLVDAVAGFQPVQGAGARRRARA